MNDDTKDNVDAMERRLVKRHRTIYMSDVEFEQCVMVAGKRNFSSWATKILLDAARAVPPPKGGMMGGACSIAGCENVGAWWLVIGRDRYLCAHCAAPIERDYSWTIKDCRPSVVPEMREKLLKEVMLACKALVEFDARMGAHTAVDLIQAAGNRPIPGMPTCDHGPFESCANCRKTAAEKQKDFEETFGLGENDDKGGE